MKTKLHCMFTLSTLVIFGTLLFTITACVSKFGGPRTKISNNPVTGPVEIQGNHVSRANIELDIYSGRPNPTWMLEAAVASDLISRIARLNSTGRVAERSQNLGYRGFIVQFPDAGSNAIQTIRAYGGIVEVNKATGSAYYADPQKQVELWLLATSASAQPPLPEDFVAQIVKEINAP